MTEPKTDAPLEGWTEIVEFLASNGAPVVERTARRYTRRRDALPVYRRLGRVVANRESVLEWLRRQTVHASARPA